MLLMGVLTVVVILMGVLTVVVILMGVLTVVVILMGVLTVVVILMAVLTVVVILMAVLTRLLKFDQCSSLLSKVRDCCATKSLSCCYPFINSYRILHLTLIWIIFCLPSSFYGVLRLFTMAENECIKNKCYIIPYTIN